MNIQILIHMTILALLMLLPLPSSAVDNETGKLRDNIIILKNSQVEAAILPCPGGRLISFKRNGGENILLFPPALLDETESSIPVVSAENPSGKEYFGFEVWLSPQSEWWIHQDLNMAKKESHSPWPPDPYHAYGKYKITDKSDQSVTLESPESPVTGIKFVKKYTLAPDGVLNIKIRAVNIRDKSISWGIWTNTRLSGETDFYAPMKAFPDGSFPITCKFFTIRPQEECLLQFKTFENFFTFDKSEAQKNRTHSYLNKAFISCSDGTLAAFYKNILFIKTLHSDDCAKTHHEHAKAEVFLSIPAKGQSLLELEFNGPYKAIAPGQFVELEENWRLIEYHGGNSMKEQVEFLKKIRDLNSYNP